MEFLQYQGAAAAASRLPLCSTREPAQWQQAAGQATGLLLQHQVAAVALAPLPSSMQRAASARLAVCLWPLTSKRLPPPKSKQGAALACLASLCWLMTTVLRRLPGQDPRTPLTPLPMVH
jgi:hypothetical protein